MDRKFINFIKLFLVLVILIFSLQSWTRADDIRDFQIEGISIGDSLLNFYSEEKIMETYEGIYPSKKFFQIDIKYSSEFETYQSMQFHTKRNDDRYIIHALSGEIVFDNIDDCLLRKKEIVSLLEDLFKNADLNDFGKRKHVLDNSGESVTYDVYFWFDDDSVIAVSCYDWTEKAVKELNTIDNQMQVTLMSKEFGIWIKGPAFDE